MSIWTAYSLGRYIQSKISNLKSVANDRKSVSCGHHRWRGLAGAALANALVRVPQVDFHVFESAPTFSERGAAVGLAKNAQLALDQILPSGTDVLDKAGTVPMNSSRIILVRNIYNKVFDFKSLTNKFTRAQDPRRELSSSTLPRMILE